MKIPNRLFIQIIYNMNDLNIEPKPIKHYNVEVDAADFLFKITKIIILFKLFE